MAANLGTAKRYPLQGLLDATGLGEHALGLRVGLTGTSLKRARANGLLEAQADLYACRAGFAPWNIWPDWLDDLEVECSERSCDRRFVPSRSNHRFCSRTCADREAARRRWMNDPEYRARKLEANRRYQAEAKRVELAKKKARYWANPESARAARRERYRVNAEAEKARQREYHRRKRAEQKAAA